MPIVRMRLTPCSRAAATSSASGAGPRSRWVWESITGPSGLREERRELLDLRAAGEGAVGRRLERRVRRPERGEQLLGRLGDVRGQHHRDDSEAFGERPQRLVELAGLLLVLGELPRRALLDVAVQAPDALPDPLERLGDLRVVEQIADLLAQAAEVG